ncbi:hypothetical protein H0H81_010989 [Sphagnurus paluster]|uniref:RING-type domain-containing protein n=1 Tax=Sphagnurus paluster TaxID=117069 RepID=A0A9P7GN78_9AGAR|nr:hypothetical protein H0H81_010989 [Sphagnurus paluster]
MARSTSHKSQPVTPQRLPSQRPQHRYSSSHSFYKSPVTPASPYTPLSLRSFTSSGSGGSSTLTTPDHIGLGVKRLSFSPEVVRDATETAGKDQSLADIADNWRSRASENGIKVSSLNDDSHFGDDEASERTLSDVANDSGFISTEEALLPPSLISNQARSGFPPARARAHSHVPPATFRAFSSPSYNRSSARIPAQPPSPLVARRLNQSQNVNLTSTPPQNRTLARQLKLKGSFTDPAHTRRREGFGPLRTPGQNNVSNKSFNFALNQDTTLDLFDIDENDFENDYDYEYNHDQNDPDDSLVDLNLHSKHSMPSNNHNTSAPAYGYPTYPMPLLPSYSQQQQFFSHPQSTPFSDPFQGNALSSITESVEHYFHTQQFGDSNMYALGQSEYTGTRIQNPQQPWGPLGLAAPRPLSGMRGGPAWVPIPSAVTSTPPKTKEATLKPISKPMPADLRKASPQPSPTGCSVCLATSPRTLAVLIPCAHPLCSACLTSALNIVGEKDMECAVCRGKVDDFRLVVGDGQTKFDAVTTGQGSDHGSSSGKGGREKERKPMLGWGCEISGAGRSFMEPLFSSPSSGGVVDGGPSLHGLESAFEFGLGLEGVRASTPKRGDSEKRLRERGRGKGKGEENVVLRIDNVPWDITPPQIHKWLQQPLERVHVLLDKRGKTLSHAYVEVADVAVAGMILRGEAKSDRPGGKPRERGSVLGKGRRARGVTVTRSGQEELMSDLFPNWRGSFDGSRPSLAGLDNERVICALEGGLIGESEVIGLLHLIKEPDSHFLKAPSLPFHSLMSILSKFPSDVDSRVFWSSGVRDMLYDVTYAAVQMLLARVNGDPKSANDNEYSMDLVADLVKTALGCHAFTTQQMNKFTEFFDSCSLQTPPLNTDPVSRSGSSAQSEPRTPENRDLYGRVSTVSTAAVEGEAPRLSPSPGGEGEDSEALAELAREFGVEAQLVQALAHRLAGLC